MARSFTPEENKPGPMPLLIGLMGAPGSGKTFSALTLAEGMRGDGLGRPVLIDTERGRSLKYRSAFDFLRIDLTPPFRPSDFLAAIQGSLKTNPKPCAVIVDSLSDEHDGEGGVLDWHDDEVPGAGGNEWAAWKKPKRDRQMMINGLLQIKTPLILCFRAREKTQQRPEGRNGKMIPVNIGWMPIAPMEIIHALDVNIVLPPKSDGRPQWRSDKVGQDFVLKLPEQFKPLFGTNQPITRAIGGKMAAWARGQDVTVQGEAGAVFAAAKLACEDGQVAWGMWWKDATKEEREAIKPRVDKLKAILAAGAVEDDPLAARGADEQEAA